MDQESLEILEYSRESMKYQEDSLARLRLLVSRASAVQLRESSFKGPGNLSRSVSRSSVSDCPAVECTQEEKDDAPQVSILDAIICDTLHDTDNEDTSSDPNTHPNPNGCLTPTSHIDTLATTATTSLVKATTAKKSQEYRPMVAARMPAIPCTPGPQPRLGPSTSLAGKLRRALSKKKVDKAAHQFRIHVVTFNMGSHLPDPLEMHEWLPCNRDYDLIAVGLQECVFGRTSSMGEEAVRNFFTNDENNLDDDNNLMAPPVSPNSRFSAFSRKSARLESLIKTHLGKEYFEVRTSTLGGMMLMLLGHVRNKDCISHTKTVCTKPTGIGGVVANKGGIVCKTRLWGTDLCFISCHLAAHDEKVLRRNADMHEVLKAGSVANKVPLDLSQRHPHTFVMGDLNYRVNLAILDKEVKEEKAKHFTDVHKLIREHNTAKLTEADQLGKEMSEGNVLQGFQETTPTFEPTYKLKRDPGLGYISERIPSYCDRILWTSLPGFAKNIEQNEYNSCPLVSTSDHKPVFADFTLTRVGQGKVPEFPLGRRRSSLGRPEKLAASADGMECHVTLSPIRVSKVSCEILNQISDCVLKVSSTAMTADKVGIVKEGSLSEGGDVILMSPPLPLKVHSKDLDTHHLFFTLWNRETNLLVAQGVVSLGLIFEAEHEQVEFVLPLLRYGRSLGVGCGEMKGEMRAAAKPVGSFSPLLPRHFKRSPK